MDSNIQTQLNELKATLDAIRQGIEALEARLTHPEDCHCNDCEHGEACSCDDCERNRADFNAYADDYNRRHPYPSNMRQAYESDPSYNGHPSSFR